MKTLERLTQPSIQRSLVTSLVREMAWRLLAVSLVATGCSYLYTHSIMEREFERHLRGVVASRKYEISAFVRFADRSCQNLRESFEVEAGARTSAAEVRRWMDGVRITAIDGFENFWIVMEDGHELISWPHRSMTVLAGREALSKGHGRLLKKAQESTEQGTRWMPATISPLTNNEVISVFIPVVRGGRVVALIGHDLNPADLLPPLVDRDSAEFEGRDVFILDEQGRVIFMPQAERSKMTLDALKEIYSTIADEGPRGTVERLETQDVQVAAEYLPEAGWYLISVSPLARMREATFRVSLAILFFGLLALAVDLMFFYRVIERRLKRPLEAFLSGIQRIAGGDLGGKVQVGGEDELGYLASAFNSMVRVLQKEKNRRLKYARDLEEDRRKAETANQAKSQFLANMSHEIRTPINGILGLGKILSTTALQDEQRDMLRMMEDSASNLLVIINDILDLSKVEAGKLTVEKAPFDFGALLLSVKSTLGYEIMKKKITFFVEDHSGVDRLLVGDVVRLRQILLNLVGNAVKFTPEKGTVQLRVSSQAGAAGLANLRFEIQDNGVGISEDARRRLFQPFTQAETSTARKFGGTGLGLMICKNLVEHFGGRIGVESVQGSGSTFWFELSFELGGSVESISREKGRAVEDSATLKGRRVLVADDNNVNLVVAKKVLLLMDCEVECVTGGEEALQALARSPFDVLLLDCQMPGKDGYETAREIRASSSPQVAGTRIIALTAAAMEGDRDRCLAAGMEGFVTKPIDLKALRLEMERVLATREAA